MSVICKTDHHPKDVKQLRRGWCDHISMSSRSGRGKRSIAAIPVNCANSVQTTDKCNLNTRLQQATKENKLYLLIGK